MCAALPLLLHLVWTTFQPDGVLEQHGWFVGWAYGLPAIVPLAWLSADTLPSLLGGRAGTNLGFVLENVLWTASTHTQAAVFVVALTLGGLLGGRAWRRVQRGGWVKGVVDRPVATLITVLLVPVSCGVALGAARALLALPPASVEWLALLFRSVLYTEMLAARWAIVVLFPLALAIGLVRGWLRRTAAAS